MTRIDSNWIQDKKKLLLFIGCLKTMDTRCIKVFTGKRNEQGV